MGSRVARERRPPGWRTAEVRILEEHLLEKPKFIRIGQPPLRVEIHTDIAGVAFSDCFSRCEVQEIEGIPVNFIGLQDLKANKQAAGRTKDLADIEALPD